MKPSLSVPTVEALLLHPQLYRVVLDFIGFRALARVRLASRSGTIAVDRFLCQDECVEWFIDHFGLLDPTEISDSIIPKKYRLSSHHTAQKLMPIFCNPPLRRALVQYDEESPQASAGLRLIACISEGKLNAKSTRRGRFETIVQGEPTADGDAAQDEDDIEWCYFLPVSLDVCHWPNKPKKWKLQIHPKLSVLVAATHALDMETLTAPMHLDMTLPTGVTKLPFSFLVRQTGIRSLKLRGIAQLTTIDFQFCRGCQALRRVEFPEGQLQNLQTVEQSFLSECTALECFDLSMLAQATKIHRHEFMHQCNGVASITYRSLPRIPTTIGLRMNALREIDVCGCHHLTGLGFGSFAYLPSLQKMSLAGLENVTSIGDYCFIGLPSLDPNLAVDWSPLRNVKTIGSTTFAELPFEKINFNGLGERVESIGECFLCRNTALQEVQFGSWPRITSVGKRMGTSCDCLTTVDCSAFGSTASGEIAFGWPPFEMCGALKSVKMSSIMVDSIGEPMVNRLVTLMAPEE